MKYFISALAFSFLSISVAANEHTHRHSEPTKPEAAGKKFEPDAPLKKRIREIREAIGSQMPAFHEDKMKQADYSKLANKIESTVQLMIKECKLAPEADNALHGAIAKLMAGSSEMKTNDKKMQRKGFETVSSGIESYRRLFNDPTLEPL